MHQTLLVSDQATRPAAEFFGIPLAPWRRAPNRAASASATDPLEDWRAKTPWGVVKSVCDFVMCGPASAYAADTLEIAREFRPDVIVSQELLFGVMAAAEAAHLPLALLTGNIWCFPTREDVSPFGPAFPPPRGPVDQRRDAWARQFIAWLYDVGLADLNRARAELGLAPVKATLDQLAAAQRVLLGAAESFDFGRTPPPAPFNYVGPLFMDPPAPRLHAPQKPLRVVVSFSTTYQRQAPVINRCIRAVESLEVEALVTLGPAVRPQEVSRAANVTVVASAPHDEVVPGSAAMICHGGHGTAIRPLIHGVPVLCLPMGRDQPENARRITERGAGLTLPKHASARAIKAAIQTLVQDVRFRDAAHRLGAKIAAEMEGGSKAATLLERMVISA